MSSTRVFICSGYNGSPSSQPRGSSLSSNIKEMSWYLIFEDFGRWYMGALKIYLLFGKWFQLLKLQRSFLQRFLFVWLSSDLCLKWQMSVHSNLRSDPIHIQTFQISKAVDMRHFCCWHHLGNEKASKPEQKQKYFWLQKTPQKIHKDFYSVGRNGSIFSLFVVI